MRLDNVATRILLILSVVHAAATAPAIIRQRSLEVTKNVTPALEKRANLDDDSSHLFPRIGSDLPSTSGILPSQDDTLLAPGNPHMHSDSPPELGIPQLHIEHPPTSETGTPQMQDDMPPTPGAPPLQDDPLPVSGTPQLHNDHPSTPGAPPSQDDTVPGSGTPQSQDETSPASGDPELHSGPPPELGTPQLHNDQPSTPGALPLPDDTQHTLPGSVTLQSQDETSQASGDAELHSGPPPELETSQLHINQPVTSGSPQLHIDRPPTSGTPQSQDDLPLMPETPPSEDYTPVSSASGTLQLHDDQRPRIGALILGDEYERVLSENLAENNQRVHDALWQEWVQSYLEDESLDGGYFGETLYEGSPGETQYEGSLGTPSEAPQLQNDPPPASGASQLHRVGSEDFDTSSRWVNDLPLTEWRPSSSDFDSETPPPLHLETPSPLHSETPLHLDSEIPPPLHSETPPPLHLDAPPPWHLDAPPSSHSETLQLLESEALPSAPETHSLFNDAMRQKLKNYAVVGAVASATVGLALGVDKLIKNHSHGFQRTGRDLASSGVVGRGASMHPRPLKNPVSRAPAKLRDEDLRLLSILTLRALERLD